jgi:hypothetical protein
MGSDARFDYRSMVERILDLIEGTRQILNDNPGGTL